MKNNAWTKEDGYNLLEMSSAARTSLSILKREQIEFAAFPALDWKVTESLNPLLKRRSIMQSLWATEIIKSEHGLIPRVKD